MLRLLALITSVLGCGSVAGEPDAPPGVIDANPVFPDARPTPDASAPDAAAAIVVAELAADTAADELPDDWVHDQLAPVLAFTGGSRWVFTCEGGGATAGTWTVDMTKLDADTCINRIVAGPAIDVLVTQVAGPPLTAVYVRCGEGKQLSLRSAEGEWFTYYPVHTGSFEGQWCNNVVSSGTAPPSDHNLTVLAR